MKKGVKILLLAIGIVTTASYASVGFSNSNYVYAKSLDDVIGSNGNKTNSGGSTKKSSSDSSLNLDSSSSQFVDDLNDAADMSNSTTAAKRGKEAMEPFFKTITQWLAYLIVFGLTCSVVADICYVAVPFSRKLLGNGHQGVASSGQQGGDSFGGGFGGSSFGGGFGGSSFGGGQQGNQQGGGSKIQLVSNAALNAVESSKNAGPDGKPQSAMKIYMKDMIVLLTLTPILIVLAITGVLGDVGFFIGNVVVNAIRSMLGAV